MITAATVLSVVLVTNTMAPVGSVAVDVQAQDVDGESQPALEQQLGEKLTAALADQGLTLTDGEADGRVVITVRRVDIIDYEVEVRVELDGEGVEPWITPFSCGSCRVVELYDRVLEHVPQIVDALASQSEPTAPEVSPLPSEPADSAESSPTSPPDDDAPRARRIGALGISGIAVIGAGLGALTYGSVLATRGTATVSKPDEDRFNRQESYSRPAWAWLGVGMGAAVIGATMLAVDLTVLRKRRQQRIVVRPSVVPGLVGTTIRLRF